MARKVALLTAGLAVLAAASLSNAQNQFGYTWGFSDQDWSSCEPPAQLTNTKCEFKTRSAQCQMLGGAPAPDQYKCDRKLKPADQKESCSEEKACKHAGVCSSTTYTCDCLDGFTGDLCEVSSYIWNATAWGACENQVANQTCGAQVVTREVICVLRANMTYVVDDQNCVADEKPATSSSSDSCTEPVGTCSANGSCNATTVRCD